MTATRFEQYADTKTNGQHHESEKPRFTVLFDDELVARPRSPQLIEGVYSANSLIMLYAKSGDGKTFVALDQGLSIQHNEKWFGRKVTQGSVVYSVLEGHAHFHERVAAWKLFRGIKPEKRLGLMVVEEPIMMRDPIGVLEFIDTILAIDTHPRLIIFDTLARAACGLNENDQKDMGLFINSCDVIRKRTGAAVCLLHHPGKLNGAERGSSVLRAACDTVLSLSRDGTALTLKVDKQKDGVEIEPIHMTLQRVEYGEIDSCVITTGAGDLPDTERKALKILQDCFDGRATKTSWRDVCVEEGIKRGTFYRVATSLKRKNLVREEGAEWAVSF